MAKAKISVVEAACKNCGTIFERTVGRGGYPKQYCKPSCRSQYGNRLGHQRGTTVESGRKALYGISVEDQREMWATQGGACGSCGHVFTRLGEAHLDHNHETGRVRAFLCGPCNRIVGQCRESAAHLLAVVSYLDRQHSLEDVRG